MTPRELADQLIGTCSSTDPEEVLGSSMEVLTEFDRLAFCCGHCGWWFGFDSEEGHDAPNGHDFLCDECHAEAEAS